MLLLSHPTGNPNVRALLQGASARGALGLFATSVGFAGGPPLARWLPAGLAAELRRRSYAIPPERLHTRPWREALRLAAGRVGWQRPLRHETGWASVDAVYHALDRHVADRLWHWYRRRCISAVYAYEDGARDTLLAARGLGLRAVYDLPIAYHATVHRLLAEEAERWPAWQPTLVATADSAAKLERKREELLAAEVVVCPSRFVLDSVPDELRRGRRFVVAEFGSPPPGGGERTEAAPGRPLRLLFAGSMGQRKGLADLFEALRLLDRRDVELVVMGSPLLPLAFYQGLGVPFRWEPPRPHAEVLALMDRCDVLVLPSIAEGRALVQQEALSRGLPIVVTPNAGGEDLVQDGETGFLVPIRAPQVLAERIAWLADHRDALPAMAAASRRMAARLTWHDYAQRVLDAAQGDGP